MTATEDDDDERLSKLATHRAEQNEIDGTVNQRHDVEQVSNIKAMARTMQ